MAIFFSNAVAYYVNVIFFETTHLKRRIDWKFINTLSFQQCQILEWPSIASMISGVFASYKALYTVFYLLSSIKTRQKTRQKKNSVNRKNSGKIRAGNSCTYRCLQIKTWTPYPSARFPCDGKPPVDCFWRFLAIWKLCAIFASLYRPPNSTGSRIFDAVPDSGIHCSSGWKISYLNWHTVWRGYLWGTQPMKSRMLVA